MATTTYPPPRTTPPQPAGSPCGCPAPCPVCGGLQCLCRPRFFAGQILTDDDLNRLEQYVIQKNKLHNRYLHGWGVVCGLKVGCGSCRDRVTVQPGYALSPCGDDIIVCQEDGVSICDLIRRCRPVTRPDADCPPQTVGNGNDCQAATEDWILAICYDEQATRGVMPLRASVSCGCNGSGAGCKCGGNSGGKSKCGCGKSAGTGANGAGANGSSSYGGAGRVSSRTAPPQCEPTLTCEGYTFTAYRAPVSKRGDASSFGPLVDNALACWATVIKNFPDIPDLTTATAADVQQWLCSTRQALADLFTDYPPQNCALLDLLAQVTCPAPGPNDTAATYLANPAVQAALQLLIQALGQYAVACFCDALLPPCPAPVDCNCVPLATVTVRRSDCNVLKVCNWGARKFALTFPDITYWMESTGLSANLRRGVEAICCAALSRPTEPELVAVPMAVGVGAPAAPAAPVVAAAPPNSANPAAGAVALNQVTPFASLLSDSWNNEDRTIDARTLAMAALGITGRGKPPAASPFEMANPLTFLVANQVVRPTVEATVPPELTHLWRRLASDAGRVNVSPTATPNVSVATTPAPASAPASAADLAKLQAAVDALQQTVAAQQATINSLRKKK